MQTSGDRFSGAEPGNAQDHVDPADPTRGHPAGDDPAGTPPSEVGVPGHRYDPRGSAAPAHNQVGSPPHGEGPLASSAGAAAEGGDGPLSSVAGPGAETPERPGQTQDASTGPEAPTEIGITADPTATPHFPGQPYPAAPGHPAAPPDPTLAGPAPGAGPHGSGWGPPPGPAPHGQATPGVQAYGQAPPYTPAYGQPPDVQAYGQPSPAAPPSPHVPQGNQAPPGAYLPPGTQPPPGAYGHGYRQVSPGSPPAGQAPYPGGPGTGGSGRRTRPGVVVALVAVIVVAAAALAGGAFLLVRAVGSSASAVPAGFRAVDTPYLHYAVPGDWPDRGDHVVQAFGVTFTGGADAPSYTCRGDQYLRGTVTSALVDGAASAEQAAHDFAVQFGTTFYTETGGGTPRLDVAPTRSVQIDGAAGSVVEVVASPPRDDGCLATRGSVAVLAVPVPTGGTAVLLVNGDLAGGPGTPPPVAPETLRAIVDSARLPQR